MKYLFSAFLLTAFFCCTPKEEVVPKNILPVDTMKVLVWDMTEAGELADYKKETDTLKKPLNTVYFSEVLKLHHLDKKTFATSFNYYQSHPYLNKLLFDSVQAYANRQRGEIFKAIE